MKVYSRSKFAGNLDNWNEVRIRWPVCDNWAFFEKYNYRINGVVYRTDSLEWREEFGKLRMWGQLSD